MRIRILHTVFWICIVLGIIGIIITGILLLKPFITQLDVNSIGSIITGVITLTVGLGAVLVTQSKIKKRELDEAHREEKIKLYNKFNDKIFELYTGMNDKTKGDIPDEQNLIDFMVEFKRDLMFRASPSVIKSIINFEIVANHPKKTDQVLRAVDDIYKAMRRDIGLSNFGLGYLELIQILLKEKSDVWKIK